MTTQPRSSIETHRKLVWRELPDLPQALGGQFVGVLNDRLVVAGGSYFQTPPWSGGKKIWVDTIYTLGHGDSTWRLAGHLPTPLGYGAAVSTPAGMLCVGGQTPAACSAKTYRLRLLGAMIAVDRLPDLPQPASMIGGTLGGKTVYVAGGQDSPTSTSALYSFLSLSLTHPNRWIAEPAWPGSPRILPLVAGNSQDVFLISGSDLTGQLGPPVGRRFLCDAFRYSPDSGWASLPNLPHAVQGGVALMWHDTLLVFGGNDGSLADREYELKENHPGFSKDILRLNVETRHWEKIGSLPYSLATTGIVLWGDECVIAGGEIHPAFRSAKVIAGHFE